MNENVRENVRDIKALLQGQAVLGSPVDVEVPGGRIDIEMPNHPAGPISVHKAIDPLVPSVKVSGPSTQTLQAKRARLLAELAEVERELAAK